MTTNFNQFANPTGTFPFITDNESYSSTKQLTLISPTQDYLTCAANNTLSINQKNVYNNIITDSNMDNNNEDKSEDNDDGYQINNNANYNSNSNTSLDTINKCLKYNSLTHVFGTTTTNNHFSVSSDLMDETFFVESDANTPASFFTPLDTPVVSRNDSLLEEHGFQFQDNCQQKINIIKNSNYIYGYHDNFFHQQGGNNTRDNHSVDSEFQSPTPTYSMPFLPFPSSNHIKSTFQSLNAVTPKAKKQNGYNNENVVGKSSFTAKGVSKEGAKVLMNKTDKKGRSMGIVFDPVVISAENAKFCDDYDREEPDFKIELKNVIQRDGELEIIDDEPLITCSERLKEIQKEIDLCKNRIRVSCSKQLTRRKARDEISWQSQPEGFENCCFGLLNLRCVRAWSRVSSKKERKAKMKAKK